MCVSISVVAFIALLKRCMITTLSLISPSKSSGLDFSKSSSRIFFFVGLYGEDLRSSQTTSYLFLMLSYRPIPLHRGGARARQTMINAEQYLLIILKKEIVVGKFSGCGVCRGKPEIDKSVAHGGGVVVYSSYSRSARAAEDRRGAVIVPISHT